MTELVEVGRFETLADAKQRALVLAAVGIDCSLVASDRAVALYVSSAEAEDARQQLGCYESENYAGGAATVQTDHAWDRRSAGLLRRVAVLLRRGAQARPVGRLVRDRCCAGGPHPRRRMVANVDRSEPPCRSSPFAEQSGLRRHLRNLSGTAPRLRSRVARPFSWPELSGTRSTRWFSRRNTPRSAPRPASLARWAFSRVTCGAPAWCLGEAGSVVGRHLQAGSCF